MRQRFTIAHECGHFLLHQTENEASGLFVDRRYAAFYWRDGRSSEGEDIAEVEANQFAASLLMPTKLVLEEIQKQDFDLTDEEALNALASKFEVSIQAMSFRLANLGILKGIAP